MNNCIKNPKVEVPSGIKLNDKDYINSLLSLLKEMEKNYVVALTEASNENIYIKYKGMFDEFASLQREVFEEMFRKGWYVLCESSNDVIDSTYNMLNQELNNL